MAHVRIISIVNPAPSAVCMNSIDYKHSKFVHRKKYVDEVFLPRLKALNLFDSVEIFPAITPDHYKISDGYVTYKDVKLKIGAGCQGNFLSNYMLWRLSIELNDTVLILEDDALLPDDNVDNVVNSLKAFASLPNEKYLLYLLSQRPRSDVIKDFSMSKVNTFDKNFLTCFPIVELSPDKTYDDFAGTAAYAVRPDTAKSLCDFADRTYTEATDRFLGRSNAEHKVNILLPNDFANSFLLYEQTAEWNSVHKNTVPPKWTDLPPSWQFEYLMRNNIKLENRYVDEINNEKTKFTREQVDAFIKGAKERKCAEYGVYGKTDEWLYEALDMVSIKDQTVAVMGSIRPWYESVVLSYGGLPTTVEYNLPNFGHPSIDEILLTDVLQSGKKFDIGISISSFEHDGLGRYGDPLNVNGDLRAMAEMKIILKPGGILFLAVPCGLDKIAWNAHRIYGNKRLPFLLHNWEVIGTVGYDENMLFVDTGDSGVYQPIIVLKNT